jgi:hypothetical protein
MGSPILPYTTNGRLAGARLCEFHTGSAKLLNGHKDWISKYFVPKMKQHPNAWVDLVGSASMLGDPAMNRALSEKRIAAVEDYIKSQHPGIKFNVRMPQGADDAQSFDTPKNNNDGYWRAVLVKWFGVPLAIETPVYPPEPPPQIKYRKWVAPKGCWCIVGLDTFGIPIKAGVSLGKADLTLLNDKGEKWVLRGLGAGLGAGVDVNSKHVEEGVKLTTAAARLLVENLKNIGLKAGDITSVSKTTKDLNIVGPNETNGGVFRGVKWEANLTLNEITQSGFFTIVNGAFHLLIGGGETGLLYFGVPGPTLSPAPWGFYGQAGLATWKAAAEIGGTVYKIIGKDKEKEE